MNASAEAMTTAMPMRPTPPVHPISIGNFSQYVPSPTTLVHTTVAFLGWIMLLAGTLLGLCTAVDMPGLIMIDARHGVDYGGPTPGMARLFMGVATFVAMLIACGLLMGSRRPHGSAHMMRALFAVVMAGACVSFVYGAFTKNGGLRASQQRAAGLEWPQFDGPAMFREPPVRAHRSAVIEQYIDDMEIGLLIPAGMCAVAVATLLTWPARPKGLSVQPGRETSNA